ncbi:MAG: hypothetical protein ACRC80_17170, partial [Waterburya sp.]
ASIYIPDAVYLPTSPITLTKTTEKFIRIFSDGGAFIDVSSFTGGAGFITFDCSAIRANSNLTLENINVFSSNGSGKFALLKKCNRMQILKSSFYELLSVFDSQDSFAVSILGCLFKRVKAYHFVSTTKANGLKYLYNQNYDFGHDPSVNYGYPILIQDQSDNINIDYNMWEGCRRVYAGLDTASLTINNNYIEYCKANMIDNTGSGFFRAFQMNNNWLFNDGYILNMPKIHGGEFKGNTLRSQIITWASGSRNINIGNTNTVDGVSSLPPSPTTFATLINGFSGNSVGYTLVDGVVYLEGELTNANLSGNAAFNLPDGYRPKRTHIKQAYGDTAAQFGSLTIDSNGNVVPSTTFSKLKLDGISFLANKITDN